MYIRTIIIKLGVLNSEPEFQVCKDLGTQCIMGTVEVYIPCVTFCSTTLLVTLTGHFTIQIQTSASENDLQLASYVLELHNLFSVHNK